LKSESGGSSLRVAMESRRQGPQSAARALAEDSGGFAVMMTNNLEAGLARIRETAAYYLVGYYSTNTKADGKFRRQEIKIDRRGARVLHRGGYFAVKSPGGAER
jgi:hypothetical protein